MTIERRKYFRIQDFALVKYRVVQSEMLEYERHSVYLNQIKVENTRAALFGLETQFQEILEKIRRTDPLLVEALELINRKMNLLERVVSLENSPLETDAHVEHEPREINLSGGGMAIVAEHPLAAGAHLAIDLVLLPANDPMRIFGKVVNSRKNDGDQYSISIVFDDIRQDDQDRLIQHVLRRQSSELRAARMGANDAA